MARHKVLTLCCAVIATVALGCSEGPAELAVHAPGGTSTTTGGGLSTSSTSVSISPPSATIKVGQTIQFTGTASASLLPLEYGFDRPDLISLTSSGVVQGLAAGTAHVAVRSTVDTTRVAIAQVTIQP